MGLFYNTTRNGDRALGALSKIDVQGDEVIVNDGLSVKSDGDVTVGKDLEVDGTLTVGGEPITPGGGSKLYLHNVYFNSTSTSITFQACLWFTSNSPDKIKTKEAFTAAMSQLISSSSGGVYYICLNEDDAEYGYAEIDETSLTMYFPSANKVFGYNTYSFGGDRVQELL